MTTAYEIALNLFNNSYGDAEYRMTASAVKILHPRMYTTFIDKVQDL